MSFAQRLWQQLGRAGVDLLPLSANISTTLEDGEQDIIARLQEKHQSEVHALHTELTAVRSADEALLTDLVKEVNSLTAELDTVRSTNANLAQQYEASKKEAALAWQCLAKRTGNSLPQSSCTRVVM